MRRREFLKFAAAGAVIPNFTIGTPTRNFGWIPDGIKTVSYKKPKLKSGKGKVALLWKAYEQAVGPWIARKQAIMIGDCVAQATGGAVDLLTNVQKDRWITASSTDMIFAGGRNHIARHAKAGMRGEWAVGWLKRYGNLLRQPYPPYDLTEYSAQTNKKWDRSGVPVSLQKEAKKHPADFFQVNSWTDVRDAVASGYPVVFCAPYGAENSRRDKDGFLKPKGEWYHSWLLAGIQDVGRPGALLINSHGPEFGSGPKTHGQPNGSVWLDAKYVHRACRDHADSYAVCNYTGFKRADYNIW